MSVRYRYNTQIDPPAPFAHVTVGRPDGGAAIPDLPAQLDTAADLSVLPEDLIVQLGLVPIEEIDVAGFGGDVVSRPVFLAEMTPKTLSNVTVKVLGSAGESFILIGRDVLNQFRVTLNGRDQLLEKE